MSGLNQRFTKPSFLNWNREFESRSLRKQNPERDFLREREQSAVSRLCRDSNDGAIPALAKAGRESVHRLKISDEKFLSRVRYSRSFDEIENFEAETLALSH